MFVLHNVRICIYRRVFSDKVSGVKSKISALESLSIQKVGVYLFCNPPCGPDKTVIFKRFKNVFQKMGTQMLFLIFGFVVSTTAAPLLDAERK